MLRRLILIGLIAIFSCEEVLIDNPIFPDQEFLEKMVVDFELEEVTGSQSKIKLIDISQEVVSVQWSILFDKDTYLVYIGETLPGDTVVIDLPRSGKYVISLEGYGVYLNGLEKRVVKKVAVKEFIAQDIIETESLIPYVKEIAILDYPSYDSNGLSWDSDGSGPDISLTVYDGIVSFNGEFRNIYTSDTTQNVSKNILPLRFTLDEATQLKNGAIETIVRDIDSRRENLVGDEQIFRSSFNPSFFSTNQGTLGEEVIRYGYVEVIIDWREQ